MRIGSRKDWDIFIKYNIVHVHLRFLPKRGTKLHRYVTKTFVHLQVLQVSAINVKLSLLSLFPNQTLIRSMLRDEQLMSRNAVPWK